MISIVAQVKSDDGDHLTSAGKKLPVGRVGAPADIAECYLYCMKAGFTTGSSIVADGGQSLLSL